MSKELSTFKSEESFKFFSRFFFLKKTYLFKFYRSTFSLSEGGWPISPLDFSKLQELEGSGWTSFKGDKPVLE